KSAGNGRFIIFIRTRRVIPHPFIRPLRVFSCNRTSMIDHGIKEYSYSFTMGCFYQLPEIVPGSVIGIYRCPVFCPVTMVTISDSRPFICSSVDLFHDRGHPDGVYSEVGKIPLIDLLSDPL